MCIRDRYIFNSSLHTQPVHENARCGHRLWANSSLPSLFPIVTALNLGIISRWRAQKYSLLLSVHQSDISDRRTQHWTEPTICAWASLLSLKTHINGASHERATFMCFQHDPQQVRRVLPPQLKHLSHTSCEVLHGLRGAATLQGLIGSVQPANSEKQLARASIHHK